MAKTPSKKSAKAPKKAAGGKKKKTRVESYSTYIYRVLKQVHPDTGISKKGAHPRPDDATRAPDAHPRRARAPDTRTRAARALPTRAPALHAHARATRSRVPRAGIDGVDDDSRRELARRETAGRRARREPAHSLSDVAVVLEAVAAPAAGQSSIELSQSHAPGCWRDLEGRREY